MTVVLWINGILSVSAGIGLAAEAGIVGFLFGTFSVWWVLSLVCGGFQAVFMEEPMPEYDSDGKIDRVVIVNKGRWT